MAYIIPTLCRSCGECEQACPTGAIYCSFGRYRVDPQLCTDCGTCRSVCTHNYPAPDSLRVTAYDERRERRIRELEALRVAQAEEHGHDEGPAGAPVHAASGERHSKEGTDA